ncbi:MAG: GntR family transcriptional regulator [Clostridiales bacterium]|nr:GntR family transcriptional regulator [Clostridiales bacterium]
MEHNIRTATIKEKVYYHLHKQILHHQYRPGEWLQETEIAERLNVSRSPVREALHMLVKEGLATEVPQRGVWVRTLSPKDVEEIFALRILLEGDAIKRIGKQLLAEDAAALRECLSREYAAFSERNDLWGETLAEGMHGLVVRLGKNSTALGIHEKLCSMLTLLNLPEILGDSEAERCRQEHEKIVKLLLANDPAGAAQLNAAHQERAMELILAHMSQKRGSLAKTGRKC